MAAKWKLYLRHSGLPSFFPSTYRRNSRNWPNAHMSWLEPTTRAEVLRKQKRPEQCEKVLLDTSVLLMPGATFTGSYCIVWWICTKMDLKPGWEKSWKSRGFNVSTCRVGPLPTRIDLETSMRTAQLLAQPSWFILSANFAFILADARLI